MRIIDFSSIHTILLSKKNLYILNSGKLNANTLLMFLSQYGVSESV